MHKLKCIYCGVDFESRRYNAKSCGKRDMLHRPKEKIKTTTVKCEDCGKDFEISNSHLNRQRKRNARLYCSRKCMGNAYKNRRKLICSECGVEFERVESGIEDFKHYFCSKKCQKENIDYILRGSEHYRYIDGESRNSRGKGWVKVRKIIRKRDNYTCQRCGIHEEEYGKALDVHHIKPYRLFDNYIEANQFSNLISYCSSCHHTIEVELNKI
jgi:5-methylcytosine-specific restriction endonuclease McrA